MRFRTILAYRTWTLQRLFDRLKLPPEIQAILATQIGDLGLPPKQVSLVIYAGLISSYGSGAYHPTRHFAHFIQSVVAVVKDSAGCAVEYEAEVCGFEFEGQRVHSVRTKDGRSFRGQRFIANMDPRACVGLIGPDRFPRRFRKKVEYEYSVSSYTLYLGVKGLDLRDHGFGAWNVWHYPHLDINGAYEAQAVDGDLSDPWLFLSTPTLYNSNEHPESRVCPEGEQILEAVTVAAYEPFRALRGPTGPLIGSARNWWRSGFSMCWKRITSRASSIWSRKSPGLPPPMSAPAPPRGNIYGSSLTPANVDFGRLKFDAVAKSLLHRRERRVSQYRCHGGRGLSALYIPYRRSGERGPRHVRTRVVTSVLTGR